jgi:uncharacterized protein YodC (DUF2158 family)
MSKVPLEVGDLVRLVSGGVYMTVNEIRADGTEIECVFQDAATTKYEVFKRAVLVKIDPRPKTPRAPRTPWIRR